MIKEAGLAASRNFFGLFCELSSVCRRFIFTAVPSGIKWIKSVKVPNLLVKANWIIGFFLSENGRGRDELDEIADSVNQMGEQIHTLIEESYKKELDRKISELNLLQEQINPHFLYNALSSISVLAMGNGDKVASRAILYLSDFLPDHVE